MSMERDLQFAIFAALNSDATLGTMVKGIYDNVTQVHESEDPADFPYVTIGDDRISEWDDSCDTGGDSDSTIHVWSRAAHQLEAKDIVGRIRDVLHRQPLTMANHDVIGVDVINTDAQRDPDGKTVHGIVEMRVVFRKT
jgi:hypothetical protein